MARKVRITVLKKLCFSNLQEEYLADPKSGPCSLFEEGQQFMVDMNGYFAMMNNTFCAEAWCAISKYIYTGLQGGAFLEGWTNDPKVMITCCNDGTRPVIFKLERIDE